MRTLWVALAVVSCGGRAVPSDPPTSRLYRDLQRIVTLSEAAGWELDREEVDDAIPSALASLCRVEAPVRGRLGGWLDLEIERLGGPVEQAYERRGRDLDAVEDLLELSRTRMLLAAAEARIDECPFWLEPEPDFSGRQILDDRWLIHLGGGGKGMVLVRGGNTDISAGGAGRLLVGRSVGPRWTWMVGGEFGGSARFPKNASGERTTLVLGVDLVTPLVIRYRLVNAYVEAEVGYFTQFREGGDGTDPGFHLGLALGGAASRQRWFFPGVALGISYERSYPPIGEDSLHIFKIGLRAAFDIPL